MNGECFFPSVHLLLGWLRRGTNAAPRAQSGSLRQVKRLTDVVEAG
jgi:hypothetical protein